MFIWPEYKIKFEGGNLCSYILGFLSGFVFLHKNIGLEKENILFPTFLYAGLFIRVTYIRARLFFTTEIDVIGVGIK